MTTRREFLVSAGAGLAALSTLGPGRLALGRDTDRRAPADLRPLVVSTWNLGLPANTAAWEILGRGGRALDAVEQGVMVVEADPTVSSVGYGGLPDRDGHVTLDACIMDEHGNAGSVCCLENILHPVAVARRVMEQTPHVMLAGEGARRFAVEQGFPQQDLLTDEARRAWENWLKKKDYTPWSPLHDPSAQAPGRGRPAHDHDTISMLALDRAGNLAGCCTTSGLSFKMHGRVGDSPIIGAALFVDNEVGAACATGIGEEVMKTVGSFLIVELMRQGLSPEQACREAVGRILARHPEVDAASDFQVGYLALDRAGRVGAYAIQPWFQYAIHDGRENRLVDVESHFPRK